MKNCPKCNLDLPSDAHFCPRCMYEYPRIERKSKSGKSVKKKKRTFLIILLLSVMFLIKFWPLIRLLIPKGKDKQVDGGNQQQVVQVFRTNDMTPDNPAIIHEFEDMLLVELEYISPILGEEVAEPYADGEYMVHEFESVEIEISQNRRVKSIYIDYLNAKDEFIEQYGIHEINGRTSRSDITEILGTPDQNLGKDEWYYRFDAEIGLPSLCIIFDENDMVTALWYYTLQ